MRSDARAVREGAAGAPTLFVFSGLPGVGKSTLAQAVAAVAAATVAAVYLRIDTIERALRDRCAVDVQGEGYGLAYRVATDNLRFGAGVVADSCNPIDLTRRAWASVVRDAGATQVNIEVVCSDADEHRARVTSRPADLVGLELPTWEAVRHREYREWTAERLVIDTAGRSSAESRREFLRRLGSIGALGDGRPRQR